MSLLWQNSISLSFFPSHSPVWIFRTRPSLSEWILVSRIYKCFQDASTGPVMTSQIYIQKAQANSRRQASCEIKIEKNGEVMGWWEQRSRKEESRDGGRYAIEGRGNENKLETKSMCFKKKKQNKTGTKERLIPNQRGCRGVYQFPGDHADWLVLVSIHQEFTIKSRNNIWKDTKTHLSLALLISWDIWEERCFQSW